MKVVYIKWFDASYQSGTREEKDLKDNYILASAGILVRETKTHISMATDKVLTEDGIWRDISHIPKANIIEKKVIEVKINAQT